MQQVADRSGAVWRPCSPGRSRATAVLAALGLHQRLSTRRSLPPTQEQLVVRMGLPHDA
jgi:hypothetical protein